MNIVERFHKQAFVSLGNAQDATIITLIDLVDQTEVQELIDKYERMKEEVKNTTDIDQIKAILIKDGFVDDWRDAEDWISQRIREHVLS